MATRATQRGEGVDDDGLTRTLARQVESPPAGTTEYRWRP